MSDDCNCPACLPYCEKVGKKCFVPCKRCDKPEVDELGPIKSRTHRVNRPLASEDVRSDER
jgi:hypothetical protein